MNIDELERLAREASPGPWSRGGPYARVGCANVKGDGSTFIADCDGSSGESPEDAKNANYIAAASPDVMAKLIAVVRAAEELQDNADQRAMALQDALPMFQLHALREALAAIGLPA